ncbi:phosphatidylserine decarboxylase family protein [Fonticella tunisiensis]|uniref:Phosphatidylserine decarboxylase proenzyme n=1 Tax=Fonticella tunisiensis TaxID=1096341 RepID=A0A4R7KP49_9CLOT|nr:phosphatidylserine decarboxylase family protein [Fonticella tunisiensis]TDT60890.1 phosphatidylserine decarboxylase [Fonticella tunisiensis]
MARIPIRKESTPYIVFLAAIVLILYFLLPVLAIIPFILLLFVLFFFRDPDRIINYSKDTFLSPADGTIMDVSDIVEEAFIGGKAKKVTIFLSLFNVHVNRSPIDGKVTYAAYRPGKYLPAFKSHASELNERNSIGIENDVTKALVHQITGFVARRIVCWSKKGDVLKQGERFGLIKFGSCTELIVPDNVEIKVKKGDVVRGGITVIGVVK